MSAWAPGGRSTIDSNMNQTFSELMKRAAAEIRREREISDLPSAEFLAARRLERTATYVQLVAALSDVPSEVVGADGTRVAVAKILDDRAASVDIVAGSRTTFDLHDSNTPGVALRFSAGIGGRSACEVRKAALKPRNVPCDSLLAAKQLVAREFADMGYRVASPAQLG